jgi:hypothetical protein
MKSFMEELEEVMTPDSDAMEVKGEDAPVKMKFKKKLTRKKKKNAADDTARSALKGPQKEEFEKAEPSAKITGRN